MKKVIGVGAAALVTAIGVAILGTQPDTIFQNGFDPPLSGRQRTAIIIYPNAPGSRSRTADLAYWDSLFGHYDDKDPVHPWPGALGSSPAVVQFTGADGGFVALGFTVTKEVSNLTVGVSTYSSNVLDGTWSLYPGYFNEGPACSSTRAGGESFTKFTSKPSANGCYFPVGSAVYLNLRLHTPSTTNPRVQFNMTFTE